MRQFSTLDALDRHPEVDVRPSPVRLRPLGERFDSGSSVARLLRAMGPFIPAVDAFRFENDFAISFEQLNDFADMLTDELVQEIVERAVTPYAAQLAGIDLNPLPFFETRIPDVVIDFVTGRLGRELAARLVDLAADPVGSDYGRCGGMAFAGYDCYLAGVPIDPTVTTPPAEGPLGDYIYDRLLDSLRLNIGTFTQWVIDLHLRGFMNEVAQSALAAAVGSVVFGPVGAAIAAFLAATTDVFDFPSGKEVLLDRTKRGVDEAQGDPRRAGRLAGRPGLRRQAGPVGPTPGAGHRLHRRRRRAGNAGPLGQRGRQQPERAAHRLPRRRAADERGAFERQGLLPRAVPPGAGHGSADLLRDVAPGRGERTEPGRHHVAELLVAGCIPDVEPDAQRAEEVIASGPGRPSEQHRVVDDVVAEDLAGVVRDVLAELGGVVGEVGLVQGVAPEQAEGVRVGPRDREQQPGRTPCTDVGDRHALDGAGQLVDPRIAGCRGTAHPSTRRCDRRSAS